MTRHSPHGKPSHRRPRGFARRASLMRNVIPSGKTVRVRLREVGVKIKLNNHRIGVRSRQIESVKTKIDELLDAYETYTPELTNRAIPLFQKKMLLERQLYVLMRKSVMLNVFLRLAPMGHNPTTEQIMWRGVRDILNTYERDEAAIDIRLRKPRLLKEYIQGEIIRMKRW